jgi:TonB family protein
MKTFTLAMTYTALALTTQSLRAQESAQACEPTIVTMRTDFPHYAQRRRQHGIVQVALRLDSNGRTTAARIVESSGHAALDRAALTSARHYWKFDVTRCATNELAHDVKIAIKFERPSGMAVSGTLNRKGLARTRKLSADPRCQVSDATHDTTVFACRQPATSELAHAAR